jgi:hypothetical protein
MTWNVYQHWDPLQVCVVGRSYPPEFYSWITVPHVRRLFEKIAIETEEDYQAIIKKLQEFGVEILRPTLHENPLIEGKYKPPPMTPRDYTAMIGDSFYFHYDYFDFKKFYTNVRDQSWLGCDSFAEFFSLPEHIQQECVEVHHLDTYRTLYNTGEYSEILNRIREQGNRVVTDFDPLVNGAMVSRIGKDLYFGTLSYDQDVTDFTKQINAEFTNTRNHVVNTGGHSDGTYCPVCPGLIISLQDVPTYAETFPDWEVVYLPGQSWDKVKDFLSLKKHNKGKWWIPGFEKDNAVIEVVEQWLSHWTGYVEETVFDVNMLIIDPKNVMVFNYNKQVFDALERFGITAHVVPFRHRYFWDGGIHCVTSDLHRQGTMQNYFPNRDTS